MTTETLAQFKARVRRERKIKADAARAALAGYYADSAYAMSVERFARGEYVTIAIAQDGTRTVTNGPGL